MTDQKRSARSATKKRATKMLRPVPPMVRNFFARRLLYHITPGVRSSAPKLLPCIWAKLFFTTLGATAIALPIACQTRSSRVSRPANAFNLFFSPRARSLVPAHLDSHIAQTFSSLSLPPQLLHSSTNVARSNAAAATLLMGLAYFFSLSLSLTALHLAFIATRPQLSAGNRFNSRRISK